MKKIRNATPHTITVWKKSDLVEAGRTGSNQFALPEGELPTPLLVLKSEFTPATAPRVTVAHVATGETASGVKLYVANFGEPYNLPSEEEGTLWVVSALVKSACPERQDFVTILGAVKDADGRVCGCTAFAR